MSISNSRPTCAQRGLIPKRNLFAEHKHHLFGLGIFLAGIRVVHPFAVSTQSGWTSWVIGGYTEQPTVSGANAHSPDYTSLGIRLQ